MPNELIRANDARPSRAQLYVLGALLVGYALLSHYSSSGAAPKGLSVALSFGPIVLISAVLLWRWTRPWLALVGAAIAGAIIFRCWGFLEMHYEAADLIEQCGAYGLIAISFAHSTFRVPLCTRLAQEMYGALGERENAYMRAATIAWAVFYSVLTIIIAVLYFFVSQRIWSLFVNFAAFGLIAAACAVDYLLRQWLLPRRSGGGLFTMLQRALIG